MEVDHKERAHSKFSASGSERWLKCAFSVEHEENSPPSKDSFWSREGTLAHEVLEKMLNGKKDFSDMFDVDREMISHCTLAAQKMRAIAKAYNAKLFVERKVFAMFIHPEMFGTVDGFIPEHGGTLHIIDFKYGAGHVVKAKDNTQLIQYALSIAESYDWDFTHVKMWILQPRVDKEEWYDSWTITIEELKKKWLPLWQKGVARVVAGGNKPFPGSHCHWCRGKLTCPAKNEKKAENFSNVFKAKPIGGTNGKEESETEIDFGEKIVEAEIDFGEKIVEAEIKKGRKAKAREKENPFKTGKNVGAVKGSSGGSSEDFY